MAASVCQSTDYSNKYWISNTTKNILMHVSGSKYCLLTVMILTEWYRLRFHYRTDSRLHPANERRRYKVTPSLIDWAQTDNQPCIIPCKPSQSFGIIQNKPINIWIPYISNAERQTTSQEIYLYHDEGK